MEQIDLKREMVNILDLYNLFRNTLEFLNYIFICILSEAYSIKFINVYSEDSLSVDDFVQSIKEFLHFFLRAKLLNKKPHSSI